MDKHGQQFMVGILILVMAVVMFIATLPAIKSVIQTTRGCDWLNCNGYIDPDASGTGCSATNQSYTKTLEEDTLSCTILELGIPYLVLGVLIAAVSLLLSNRLMTPPPEQAYGGY